MSSTKGALPESPHWPRWSIVLPFVLAPNLILALIALCTFRTRTLIADSFKSHNVDTTPPTRLSFQDIVCISVLVLLKYITHPFGRPLGLSPSLSDDGNGTIRLPSAEISAPLSVTDNDVRQYRRAVSSQSKKTAGPATGESEFENPIFVLTALTTPLLLLLLCKHSVPILPLGAVNVRNRFEFTDPATCRRLRHAKSLRTVARMGGDAGAGRRVKRGVEFDVVIDVFSDEKLVFKQIVTILQITSSRSLSRTLAKTAVEAPQREFEVPGAQKELKVAFMAPSRWAAVCKDYNPIHMSSIAAKLFGFPGKIAHGNLVVGMVLDLASADSKTHMSTAAGKPSWLEVAFKRPMVVPINLSLKVLKNGQGFDVVSAKKGQEKVHVEVSTGLL